MTEEQLAIRKKVLIQRTFASLDILQQEKLAESVADYLDRVIKAAKEFYGEMTVDGPLDSVEFVDFTWSLLHTIRLVCFQKIHDETKSFVKSELETIESELEYFA